VGGSVPVCRAITALMKPAAPAAADEADRRGWASPEWVTDEGVSARTSAAERDHLGPALAASLMASFVLYGFDTAGALAEDVPVLLLHGDRDEILPVEEARQIAESARDASFEVVEGAGHVVSVDAPDRFSEILRAFLNRAG